MCEMNIWGEFCLSSRMVLVDDTTNDEVDVVIGGVKNFKSNQTLSSNPLQCVHVNKVCYCDHKLSSADY